MRIWFLLNLFNLLIWILIIRCSFITKHRDLFVFYDYEIKNFDVDFDQFTCRFYVVFRSWCEYHEMNLFVNRSVKLSFEIFCSFFSSLAESLSMINESKDSIDWRVTRTVKQACLIESGDEVTRCDVFVQRTKT